MDGQNVLNDDNSETSNKYGFNYFILALMIFFIINTIYVIISNLWGDVNHYWVNINDLIVDHKMPYRDYTFEYPPMTLVVFLIPRLFSPNIDVFHFSFAIFTRAS